jgi:uncharacterized OB-fold protein
MEYKLTFYMWRDGLKTGKLLGLKCKDCGAFTFPPRKICAECASENMEIVELSKKGKIISFTTCYAVPTGFQGPYVVAMAELEEGCRFMADLEGVDPTTVGMELIGQKVEVGYKEIPGDYMTGGDNRFPMTLKLVSQGC